MSEDTVAKIIKMCQGEVDDVIDLTERTRGCITDGTEDIYEGRKEFAQQILNLISTVYKRKTSWMNGQKILLRNIQPKDYIDGHFGLKE